MIPERLQPLIEETADLAARFADAGKRVYLVGGVVRDAVLNRLSALIRDQLVLSAGAKLDL